jgi:single-strand DNA-binding protein
MNKSIFKGNLTADPETKRTQNGDSITTFALAINKRWKDKEGNAKESVVFPRFDLWGASGETFAQYFHKGDQALVVAEYTQNTTGEGEEKRTFHGFRVSEWEFIGGKSGNGQKKVEEKDEDAFDDAPKETPKRGRPAKAKPAVVEDDDSETIPF